MKENSKSSPRRSPHTTRELPAWYCRLVILTMGEDREIEPWDFDEDISELGEGEGDSDPDGLSVACECDSEDECECDFLDDEEEKQSERSYAGSDAGYYYELKDQRTVRKMELRDEKQRVQKERNSVREFESRKEQEVYAAYEAMLEAQKTGDPPPLGSIAGKTFYLYSVDHVDYCYEDFLNPSKYVEFCYISPDGEFCDPPDGEAKIHGHVYMNAGSGCDFIPFRPPNRAGRQKTRLKARGSEFETVFQFISDKYLIMTVAADSEVIVKDICKPEAAVVPDAFTFVGIHMSLEERKRWLQRDRKDR
ncbi:hypothetical protein PT974_04925 [Cladobotryum mycophilum]|uniref:Uncharacterized protein n=1 Tax=Cladobotryum mycophilum TaxID=491253 RepID=A0ABR0SQJ6_9HYPO